MTKSTGGEIPRKRGVKKTAAKKPKKPKKSKKPK
jgi:hypothetical protein